jgi:hypothetical protein
MERAAFDVHMMPPASASSAAAAANDAAASMVDMEMEPADDGPSAAGGSAAAAASSSVAAAPQPAAAGAANGEPTASSSSLRPPFLQPCRNSEACPLRCEDPAHPGHLSSYPISQRAAHQSACSQRLLRCTLCVPQHFLSCSALEEHIAALMAHPDKRAFAIAQMTTLCATTDKWEENKKSRRG